MFYRLFEEYIVGFSNRLAVTPGLTGYAQVNGGYDLKPEEKIVYDMEYIEHRSVWMDLLCILKRSAWFLRRRRAMKKIHLEDDPLYE